MEKVNIPQSETPIRGQSSLGGNQFYKNISGVTDASYIVIGQVTKVYYKKGTLDFTLSGYLPYQNTEDIDGSGSAPIPVDFWGYNSNGKPFGHYRPVKIGDKVAVAFVEGKLSKPLVIGVYPDDTESYELISPVPFDSADDSNKDTQDIVLGDKKVYPSQQINYQSGSGNILRSLNGKSFMYISDNSAHYLDDITYNYDLIGDFIDSKGNKILPETETAQAWLLVHEDNQLGDDTDSHRTRFYVNKKGEFQLIFMDTSSDDTPISILEGSKDSGFTLTKRYDNSFLDQDSTDYVTLNLGDSNKEFKVEASTVKESKEQSSTLEVKSDGVYINGKSLNDYINSDSITQGTLDDALVNSDYIQKLQEQTQKAGQDAQAAADNARVAGEDAKDAGAKAEQAGEDAKASAQDIKDHIIYYSSISPEKDVYIPGKYLIINTDTYIQNGVIKNAEIGNLSVDQSKLAYAAVGSAQIEDLAVTRSKIANLAVGTAQIEDLSVTDEKVGTLSFNHMIGEKLDADQIDVVNLKGGNITVGTITADRLIINRLGDITSHLGDITDGTIHAGNNGVDIQNLPADDPDEYTPYKKALLKSRIAVIEADADSSIDYGTQTGNDASIINSTKMNLLNGTASLLSDMTVTTHFDHTKIDNWFSDLQSAITNFRNEVNSSISAMIGKTADGKHSIYTGTDNPKSPNLDDIWIKTNADGSFSQLKYGEDGWYNPGMQEVNEVATRVDKLPKPYYQADEPTGVNFNTSDTWYKTSTDSSGNVIYTPYKRNSDNSGWVPMLDNTASKNWLSNSAPASPRVGDTWMTTDNVFKKWNGNGWDTIPTQGPQGVPGTPGVSTYWHIAYANSADGKTDFSTTDADNKKYIGLLTDSNVNDSTDYTKYTWSQLKGNDGADGTQGIPGAKGADGRTPYFHIAYSNSSDGKIGFSLDNPNNTTYLGTYTDFTANDSTDPTKYTWQLTKGSSGDKGDVGPKGLDGEQGPQGLQGIPGAKGTDGETSYTHIAYSTTSDGLGNFNTDSFAGATYMGIYVDFNANDSNNPNSYGWSLIKGEKGDQGIAGKAGIDGKTPYLHTAYANSADGKDSFNVNYFTNALYIGTLTNYIQSDSTNPSDYTWARLKGDVGPKGLDGDTGIQGPGGKDGVTTYTWIKYATNDSGSNMSDNPKGMTYIGLAYNKTSSTESSTPTDYTWSLIKGDQGIPGLNGADGKTSYLHIAYANSADGSNGFSRMGNENLLTNTSDFSNPDTWLAKNLWYSLDEKYQGLTIMRSNTGSDWDGLSQYYQVKAGETYTFSLYARNANGTGKSTIYVYLNTNPENGKTASNIPVGAYDWNLTANNFQRVYITFTATTDGWIKPRMEKTNVNPSQIDVCGYKLEKGNMATDYSPAPSDNISYLYIGTYTDYTADGSTTPSDYTWAPMFDTSKKRNFISTPTTPYAIGDTWTQSGVTAFCISARDSGAFTQSDWQTQQITLMGIDTAVQQQIANGQAAKTTLDNQQIGGTNLLTETSSDLVFAPSDNKWNYVVVYSNLVAGKTYTFSSEVALTGSPNNIVSVLIFDAGHNNFKMGNFNFIADGTRQSYTFTVLDGGAELLVYAGVSGNTANIGATYHHMKLENGNMATDYSMSDEDNLHESQTYKGVTINESGLTATAGNTQVAMNSSDGFLINNNGSAILHADTNGNLTMQGNLTAGNISGVNLMGNNLTLQGTLGVTGAISANNGNTVLSSSGLAIKGANLSIMDNNGNQTTYVQDDGTFITNKGVFSGNVTTNKLIVTGSDSDINLGGGAFHVDGNGNVTANKFISTGGQLNTGTITQSTIKINNNDGSYNLTLGNLGGDYWGMHQQYRNNSLTTDTYIDYNGIHNTDNNGQDTWIQNGYIKTNNIIANSYLDIENSNSILELANQGINLMSKVSNNPWGVSLTGYELIFKTGFNGTAETVGGLSVASDTSDLAYNGFSLVTTPLQTLGNPYGGDYIGFGYMTERDASGSTIVNQMLVNTTGYHENKGVHFLEDSVMVHDGVPLQFVYDGTKANGNKDTGYIRADTGNTLEIGTWRGDLAFTVANNHSAIFNGSIITNYWMKVVQGLTVGGNLNVTGSKHSIVKISDNTYRGISAYETAEVYFGDIGEDSTDEDCTKIIGIEKLFNETVNTNIAYQVFITPYSNASIWVDDRKSDRFIIKSDKPNARFGWEIKAKRKDYEDERLPVIDMDN